MATVFAVAEVHHSSYAILAIYSTRELAEAHVKLHKTLEEPSSVYVETHRLVDKAPALYYTYEQLPSGQRVPSETVDIASELPDFFIEPTRTYSFGATHPYIRTHGWTMEEAQAALEELVTE